MKAKGLEPIEREYMPVVWCYFSLVVYKYFLGNELPESVEFKSLLCVKSLDLGMLRTYYFEVYLLLNMKIYARELERRFEFYLLCYRFWNLEQLLCPKVVNLKAFLCLDVSYNGRIEKKKDLGFFKSALY